MRTDEAIFTIWKTSKGTWSVNVYFHTGRWLRGVFITRVTANRVRRHLLKHGGRTPIKGVFKVSHAAATKIVHDNYLDIPF